MNPRPQTQTPQPPQTRPSGRRGPVGHVAQAAGDTLDAITAFRTSVRNTPLMMSAVVLGIGYVLGTVLHARPRVRR